MQTLSVEKANQKPAPQVWEALTDWTNAHRWMPGIEGMTAEGETSTGTKLTVPRPWRGSLKYHHPL